jgi:hypothetical protein
LHEYSHDFLPAGDPDDGDGVVNCDDEGVGDECLYRESLGNLDGLPVTGFAVNRFQNGFLGEGSNVLANYGGIFQHKYTRKMGSQYQDQ